jgi:aminotransferase
MRNFISERAQEIPPSGIRKFFDLALTMEDVISLGVGEPDFRTPWNICESSIYSIEQGVTSYTPNKGLPVLRETLSNYLNQHYNLSYNSDDEIIITSGVSEALDIAIRAIVDPGDEVLIAQPSYVSYAPCVTLAGGLPVPVECTEADRFKLNPDKLQEKITRKTKALMINFPNNPTGAVMNRKDLEAIADIVIDKDLLLISDEVYAELTYDGHHVAAGTVSDLWQRTITLNGFSKAYAMTGWRLGYAVAPVEIIRQMSKVQQHSVSHPTTFVMYGGMAALQGNQACVEEMRLEFLRRRDYLLEELMLMGFTVAPAEGAFYAFIRVEGDDIGVARRWLESAHVAVTPGTAFGAPGWERLSYATSLPQLQEAVNRIRRLI